jgi:hypothetical protein
MQIRLLTLAVAALCALATVMMSPMVQAQMPAQPPCMPLPDFLRVLADEYGERPVRRGYVHPGLAVMVLSNAESVPWTILRVTPDGTACGVFAGQMWQEIAPAAPKSDPS